jgi:hypothetical protein
MDLSASSLFASLIWGSIGFGLFIYGKKQRVPAPLFGGIAIMGLTYFVSSALYMSLAGTGVIAGIYLLSKR